MCEHHAVRWGWCAYDADELSVVLDGANLLLGAPALEFGILEMAMDAVSETIGSCLGHVVIDRSLLSRCDRRTRHRLEAAVTDGYITAAPDADPVILGLVEDRDVLVVSGDKFRGWQRVFPLVVGNDRNFLEPVHASSGAVLVRSRALPGRLDDADISAHEEADALKAARLRDTDGSPIGTLICSNKNCPAANKPPGTALPRRVRSDVFECMICQVPMRRIGSRRPAVGLVLSGPGGEARVWVEYGQQLMIGRSSVAGSVSVSDLAGPALSRKHLLVRVDEDAVHVRDLGSTNGTLVRRTDSQFTMEGGKTLVLESDMTLDLGGALRVRRSGRKHPFDFDAVVAKGNVRDVGGRDATERSTP